MSLIKVMKAWRAALKFTIFRKGPKLPPGKTNVIPKAKRDVETHVEQNKGDARYHSSLLRSIFSRHSIRFLRHNVSYLGPRYRGIRRMRNVPIFSLIGLSMGLDLDLLLMSEGQEDSTMSAVRDIFKDFKWEPDQLKNTPQSLNDLDINKTCVIGNGCEGAVFEAKLKTADACNVTRDADMNVQNYDLAVKAVFNYGADSNASSILRELNREIVPLQSPVDGTSQEEDILTDTKTPSLPSHPNIVDMHGYFVDDMLVTEQGKRKFPAAMPRHVDPEGCFGRNKTLYLVMRKCTTKLSDFLSSELSMATRCSLLSQLLEAVFHMTTHGVAHRDLKSDNILIDMPVTRGTPRLQVCDFGCCLAEENKSLVIPYTSSDINLGGNLWLMAPEITCATPGQDSVLDYRKSDLWACGALAYQIIGADNPFYPNNIKQLRSKSYSEDELPPLPDNVPLPIKKLVRSILTRDPAKRPSSSVAVLVVQMVLWELGNSARKHSGRCPSVGNCSSSARQRNPRVVVSKGNRKMPSTYIQYVKKERQKMGLVVGEMCNLIRKMRNMTRSGESSAPVRLDIRDISNFLCLSRLTQSDFVMALRYFH